MSEHQPIDVLSRKYKRQGLIPLDTRAYTPNRWPAGIVLYIGSAIMIGGGLWMVGKHNRRQRALREEMRDARSDILPLLQHEKDLELVQYTAIRESFEEALMEEALRADPDSSRDFASVVYAPSWLPTMPLFNTRFIPPLESRPSFR